MEATVSLTKIAPSELDTLREALSTAASYCKDASTGTIEAQAVPFNLRAKARQDSRKFEALLTRLNQ